LRDILIGQAGKLVPPADRVALNARHRSVLADALAELDQARSTEDPIFVAEHLRLARAALDRITGRAGVEDMLDSLFGRFCIGK
jgi:tRNA modification GTPase